MTRFEQLIAQLEPRVRIAFLAAVQDLRDHVDWRALIDALTRGDVNGAIAALNISPAAWTQYTTGITSVYLTAGTATASAIAGSAVGVRFDMTNPRAERWIAENVATRVVGFTQEAIRVARDVIGAGYSVGAHPHTIAVDLVGRVVGGRRTGGVIGLDGPRAYRLSRVSIGMRTAEGVRDLVVRHDNGTLGLRYVVNKATQDRILRAYRDGTAVPERQRILSEQQFANALQLDRAQTVAETETGNAVMSARDEQWHQLAESQGLDRRDVIKTWQHRRGAARYHRPDHLAMSGISVRGLDTPFVFPDGTRMQHAHDPAGGAKHVIRCGCDTTYRIDHTRGL